MSKVKQLIEKYLVDNNVDIIISENKKEATKKVIDVINSITNEKQVDMAVKYIRLFVEKYGENTFFDDLTFTMWKKHEMFQKYKDKLIFKLKKLEHEGKIDKGFVSKLEDKI